MVWTNRLKELRKRLDMSQEGLADELGVTHATVQRWESGKRNMPSSWVPCVAAVLKCHPGEIFAELPAAIPTKDEAEAARIASRLPADKRELWLQAGRMFLGETGGAPSRDTRKHSVAR